MTAPTELQQFEQDDWISSLAMNCKDLIACGYYDNNIRILDFSGNTVSSLEFSSSIKSVAWLNDTKGVVGRMVSKLYDFNLHLERWCQHLGACKRSNKYSI